MAKDSLTEFALLLKERENQSVPTISTGIVTSLPPSPMIRLSDVILLDNEQLIFAENIVASLITGDEVILIPTIDGQLYYVVGKAVRY